MLTYEDQIDWDNPINIASPLAKGLASAWIVGDINPLWGGPKLFDLCPWSNYHGALTNGPSWSGGPDGRGALSFDGTNDYVSMGDVLLDGLTACTIITTIRKPSYLSGFPGFIGKYSADNSYVYFGMRDVGATGNNYWLLGVANGVNFPQANTSGSGVIVPDNTWITGAMVFDGAGAANADRLKLYVNGLEKTLTFSGTIPSSCPTNSASLAIAALSPPSNVFTGQIADLCIFDRALSALEVYHFYLESLANFPTLLNRIPRRTYSVPVAASTFPGPLVNANPLKSLTGGALAG